MDLSGGIGHIRKPVQVHMNTVGNELGFGGVYDRVGSKKQILDLGQVQYWELKC
jgi:hypothetical protein